MLKIDRRWWLAAPAALILLGYLLGVYWSLEPDPFDVRAEASRQAESLQVEPVVGFTTTATLSRIVDNDILRSRDPIERSVLGNVRRQLSGSEKEAPPGIEVRWRRVVQPLHGQKMIFL